VKLSFLILLFLILNGTSRSAEPANPKEADIQSNKAERQQKESTKDQTPSLQPVVIDKLPYSPKDRSPASAQTPKQEAHAGPESNATWWFNLFIVIFTGCLVGVGVAQVAVYIKQARYTRRGLRLTRQAADAAKAAAETASRQTKILEDGQRPWIMVQVDEWGLPDRFDASLGFGGVIKWSAINVGRSPAFLTELVVVPDIFPYPLPDEHPDDQSPKQFAKFIIPPNGKHSSSLPTIVDAGAMQSIFDGKRCQVVYGIARYHDSMGNPHLTRFCVLRHRDAEGWKFEPVGPPNWVEYT